MTVSMAAAAATQLNVDGLIAPRGRSDLAGGDFATMIVKLSTEWKEINDIKQFKVS